MADKETKHGTLLDPLVGTDLIGIQREPDEVHYKAPLSGLAAVVGGGGGSTLEVTQINAFSTGDALCYNRFFSTWVLADADSALPCHAICVTATGADFTAQASGFMTWTGHGLLPGAIFYLSTTAGGVVTPRPGLPGQIIQRVLVPVDTNTIIVTIGEAWT